MKTGSNVKNTWPPCALNVKIFDWLFIIMVEASARDKGKHLTHPPSSFAARLVYESSVTKSTVIMNQITNKDRYSLYFTLGYNYFSASVGAVNKQLF